LVHQTEKDQALALFTAFLKAYLNAFLAALYDGGAKVSSII
jgi:hypothetical protein